MKNPRRRFLRFLAVASAILFSCLISFFAAACAHKTKTAEPAIPPTDIRLDQNWQFHRSDATGGGSKKVPAPDAPGWTTVSVPHSWNAQDAQDGGGSESRENPGYYRGPAWYKTTFEAPAHGITDIVYLRFEAVSSVADVWLNGQYLGKHRGAFNAFAFDISETVRPGANELVVRADNSYAPDLVPLSGDFPVFGGIYRPVHVLVRNAASFDRLPDATSGITIDQVNVTRERATLRVSGDVRLKQPALAGEYVVSFVLKDAAGASVAQSSADIRIKADELTRVTKEITLDNPHLWQGVEDPYLYTLEATLYLYSKNGAAPAQLDRQTHPVGFRFYSIDPEKGFFLNGKPYKLRGVNRHQDRLDKGWALSDADHAEDIALICEMGANAVRLAHYPHSDTFYALCDRNGLLVWAELPLVDTIGKPADDALPATTKRQLSEFIRQRRNFSCIFAWSIFNELYHRPSDDATALIRDLNALAHEEDPFRITTGASNKTDSVLCNTTDVFATNTYPGWYGADPAGMAKSLVNYNKAGKNRGIAVSEYGAGASIAHHELGMTKPPKTTGNWHPEEWQAFVHEQNYRAIRDADFCWGSFVWNMFDFASEWRNEGDAPGRNDKGLVTYDRKTRKDAFYFYKANWSKEDTLYITSRRFTERKDAATEVKIYTNAPEVKLSVNGKNIGAAKPDDLGICRWSGVTLRAGKNKITATATREGRALRDECEWTLVPAPAK